MGGQYLQVMLNLVGLLAVLFLVLYLTKRFKIGKYSAEHQIKVLNIVSIGAKEKIVLVEINDTKLVLGATPNHIETLYSYADSDLQKNTNEQNKEFSEQLKEIKKIAT